MVEVVLVSSVENWVMRIRIVQLKAPVQVATVCVEENNKLEEPLILPPPVWNCNELVTPLPEADEVTTRLPFTSTPR